MTSAEMRYALIGIAAIAATGCAAEHGARSAYQAQLTQARESLQVATQSGVGEYGGIELNRARNKLAAAQKAAEDGDVRQAAWLAQEAEIDTAVANATASSKQVQVQLNDLQENIRTLRDELRREELRQLGDLSNGSGHAAGAEGG
jgi:Domain of unknown function (DUF4398)